MTEVSRRETSILFSDQEEDRAQAIILLEKDIPIAVGVKVSRGRIYGFFGTAKAFTQSTEFSPSIQELKSREGEQRDFWERPPVAIAPWKTIEKIVNWKKIADERLEPVPKGVRGFVEKLFAISYLVLPIEPSCRSRFPLAKQVPTQDVFNHAFLQSEHLPALDLLVHGFEEASPGTILLTTSANLTGDPILGTYEDVIAITKGRLHTILAESETEPPEETGVSGSIIDLTFFPQQINLLRLRDYSSLQCLSKELMTHGLDRWQDFEVNFSNLTNILAL